MKYIYLVLAVFVFPMAIIAQETKPAISIETTVTKNETLALVDTKKKKEIRKDIRKRRAQNRAEIAKSRKEVQNRIRADRRSKKK